MWGLVLQPPPRLELVTAHLSLQVTLLLILKIPDHLGIAFCQLLVLLWNVPAARFCPHYVARPPALLSPCALRPLTCSVLPSPPLDLTGRKNSPHRSHV